MPRRGAREQRSNRANGLPVAPDDSADIGLPHLQSEDDHAAIGDFREHDFIGKFDELSYDKLEELSHAPSVTTRRKVVQLEAEPLIPAASACSRGR